MSYQRIGTPRFFIDLPIFARHHGIVEPTYEEYGLFHLNPLTRKSLQLDGDSNDAFGQRWVKFNILESRCVNSLEYVFILGHNLSFENVNMALIRSRPNSDGVGSDYNGYVNPTNFVNCSVNMSDSYPLEVTNDGWCMVEFRKDLEQGMTRIILKFENQVEDQGAHSLFSIGDISTGWIYEMPHSPDLSLKLGYVNESIKTQTTKGGHTLTNSGWSEPPYWLDKPQWMTSDGTSPVGDYKGFTPSSRRVWDLSFSYLDDTDMLNRDYPGDGLRSYGVFSGSKPLDTDFMNKGISDTFFAKVVHGTANFKLPFIFQPNKDVNEFAICRIDGNSFTLDQVANNVYNVSMKLTEVW